jgi:hypothetical protein
MVYHKGDAIMRSLSWKHWIIIILGGIALGLLLTAILPGSHTIFVRSAPGLPPVARTITPPITMYLPWGLVIVGFFLGVFNLRNPAVLTFAGTVCLQQKFFEADVAVCAEGDTHRT